MHISDGERTFTVPDGPMFHLRNEHSAACGAHVLEVALTSAVSIVDCQACLKARLAFEKLEVWH